MLNVILADSELELIPKKLWNHPVIKKFVKKRKKDVRYTLLDSSYHHKAMKNLKENYRRGRPDIVHFCLINALESILNKENKLRIYVHTRNNEVIYVKPETRIPRHYNRFVGLMEKLFKNKKIPEELNLLKLENKSLKELINEISPSKLFVMHPNGKYLSPAKVGEKLSKYEDPCVIVGGFPHGDFKSKIEGTKISIYPKELTAWTVLNEIIINYENKIKKKKEGKI